MRHIRLRKRVRQGRDRESLEIARALSVRAHEKGVEIVVDIDPSASIELEGDSRRFRQIVTNIVGNAIKFTYAGEVVLRARVADGQLSVVVQDRGIGISARDLTLIFDPFRQVDAETTRQFGGTGLGLSIARELLELMHGTIHADSVVDEGVASRSGSR